MMEVSVEKLFDERHFYVEVSIGLTPLFQPDHTSAPEMKCFMTITRLLTSACVKIISATQFVNWLECKINALTFSAGSTPSSLCSFLFHVLLRHSVGLILP